MYPQICETFRIMTTVKLEKGSKKGVSSILSK